MQEYDISLDNYVKGNLSICREERQYALYLSNILRYYGRAGNIQNIKKKDDELYRFLIKIYRICGLINKDDKDIPKDLIITDVFYEVTFMRDFLERNRRIKLAEKRRQLSENIKEICLQKTYSPTENKKADYSVGDVSKIKAESFNYQLVMYVIEYYRGKEEADKIKDDLIANITERNYGHYKLPKGLLSPREKKLLVVMMNAKPDLAVIYTQGDVENILFLECKFESREDNYKGDNGNETQEDNGELRQTRVQWHIASFLTGYMNDYKEGSRIESPVLMKERESVLVTFGRVQDKSKLEIDNLIKLEKTIFSGI